MQGISRLPTCVQATARTAILLITATLAACTSPHRPPAAIIHDVPRENTGKPAIKGLLDLGGLALHVGEDIPRHMSDERFSPGEWVLVQGKNVSAPFVEIDGHKVVTEHYYDNRPLVRIPTHLSPRKQHELRVTTELGTSSYTFDTSHYIVATDLDGKDTHLIRTNRKEKGGVEEEWVKLASDAVRPMFNLMTDDSRYLVHMDVAERSKERLPNSERTFDILIHNYHLAAPTAPARIASFTTQLGSSPIDATINSENTILLLGKQSITLVDANDPSSMATLSHTQLPKNTDDKTTYVDAIFLDDNKKIAVLETHQNTVLLFSINEDKTLTQVDTLALLPNKRIALSVDLEPSPTAPNAFWVLESPNYRLAGSRLSQTYKKLLKKEHIPDNKKSVHQLQYVSVQDNTLTLGKAIPTPEGYAAYFSVFGEDGRIYISTTKTDFLNTEFNTGDTKNVLKQVKNFLWDSISFGRVLAIDTNTEASEVVANGVGIYYHLVDVPDIGPVFSLLKFGPSFSFPYLSPNWGVGIKSTGTYAKRKMNKRALFPPYSVGFVDYQY